MSPPKTPFAIRKIEYLTLANEELKSVIKKLLLIYPVETWPDDDKHKIIKGSLTTHYLLTEPQPAMSEYLCSDCRCEISKHQSRGAKPRCSPCYVLWKKEQRKQGGKK